MPRHPRPAPLVDLQRTAGNRAVAAMLLRTPEEPAHPSPDAAPTLAAFDAAYPGITGAMSYEQLQSWHRVIAGWTHNRGVDEQARRHEAGYRKNAWDPDVPYIADSRWREQHERITSRRRFVDEAASRAPLDHRKLLAPEVTAPQAWNVDAEHRFRTWAVERFTSLPLVAELSSGREMVSALEESRQPGLATGIPHVNLLWGGGRIRHTRGTVTWDDLMDISEFADRYHADVADGPHLQALRKGIGEIDSHITQMKIEHLGRSMANAAHPVVRRIAEALGGPGSLELAILRLKVQENPDDLDAKAALAEKEAEAGDYPKMKDNADGPGIWHDPDVQLAAARRFLTEGKFELAVAALTECEHSTALATARFAGYERRVMGGAGVAVKWLERAKMAGKIASAFTGTGGVVRAAVGAAGYSFAQEGSQAVVASWIDPSQKVDLGALTKQAAIDGLATLFGALTQGAFVNALTARFGTRLMVTHGLSETAARTVLSAAGATTAAFYNVPAKIVLERIIAGKEVPKSLTEVCDMITTEAIQSGALDVAGSHIHARSAPGEHSTADATPTAPRITGAPDMVHALAGPEGAPLAGPRPAPSHGVERAGPEPTTIIAEARLVAGHLEPLRNEWSTLSPAARAQRLIDGVHRVLGATGLPKPSAILYTKRGGLFHQDTWVAELDGTLLSRKQLTIDEFAMACEVARHEMEHALQFFRMARREHTRTREDAAALATRMRIPIEIARAAIEANTGARPAEAMPTGGAVDVATARQHENVYGGGRRRRNEVLGELDHAVAAIRTAQERLDQANATGDVVLSRTAFNDFVVVEQGYRPLIEEYRNFPEEVPAFEAGGQVAAATRQQARLADALKAARLAERRAYAAAHASWDDAHRESAAGRRISAVTVGNVRRHVRDWVRALDAARAAERALENALHAGVAR